MGVIRGGTRSLDNGSYYPPTMENQIEKKMEHEMETGVTGI